MGVEITTSYYVIRNADLEIIGEMTALGGHHA